MCFFFDGEIGQSHGFDNGESKRIAVYETSRFGNIFVYDILLIFCKRAYFGFFF